MHWQNGKEEVEEERRKGGREEGRRERGGRGRGGEEKEEEGHLNSYKHSIAGSPSSIEQHWVEQ